MYKRQDFGRARHKRRAANICQGIRLFTLGEPARNLARGIFAHAVNEQVGLRVENERAADLIVPVVVVRKAAQAAGVELVDYFLRPELACLNAVPTAEGCLALLMQLRQRTIWESEFLVLGYGRIGRAVARRLQALGGQVTIAARAPEQRAAARCAGLHAAPLTALEQLLPHLDAVINTIPAPVLGAAQLRCLPRGALILDLASRPGGTDFAAARELGLRAEHALSLPARCAPETAGALVAHTVEVILQERAATARSERGVS